MKRIWVITAPVSLLSLLLIFSACETSSRGPQNEDTVAIKSVSASESEGRVTVEVEYDLVSADYGDLDIAFNTRENPGWYTMYSNATETVAAGTGTYTFAVLLAPSNWLENVPKSAYATLSVSEHSVPWAPLADDTEGFDFDE